MVPAVLLHPPSVRCYQYRVSHQDLHIRHVLTIAHLISARLGIVVVIKFAKRVHESVHCDRTNCYPSSYPAWVTHSDHPLFDQRPHDSDHFNQVEDHAAAK